MKVPNGLQGHALWEMDGRTWIEVAHYPYSKSLKIALDKGWAKIIPAHKMGDFIRSL